MHSDLSDVGIVHVSVAFTQSMQALCSSKIMAHALRILCQTLEQRSDVCREGADLCCLASPAPQQPRVKWPSGDCLLCQQNVCFALQHSAGCPPGRLKGWCSYTLSSGPLQPYESFLTKPMAFQQE